MLSHLSHNYMLGVGVLIFAFIFFYMPMVYAFITIRSSSVNKISCSE
ncbi:preprotein translocase subunit YajC [Acinetobacter pittii]|nr:preprotein translocase subunit YajC [Acinetobacter pittii]AZB99154.1 preprotein translocase subunit YajC [Acinetobacter pittii]